MQDAQAAALHGQVRARSRAACLCSSHATSFFAEPRSLTFAQSATAARKLSYSCARRARRGSRREAATSRGCGRGCAWARLNCMASSARWIWKLGRALEAAREPHDTDSAADQPLGRVPLPPAHAVTVVVREDVVEVVVALAVGEHRQHRVVARGVLLGVGTRAPHVRQRVDEEGDVVAPRPGAATPARSSMPMRSWKMPARRAAADRSWPAAAAAGNSGAGRRASGRA